MACRDVQIVDVDNDLKHVTEKKKQNGMMTEDVCEF